MSTITFKVAGMKCGGCEKTVQDIVNAIDGVHSSKASSPDGTLTVELDPLKTSEAELKAAVTAKGYPAS